MEQHPDDAMRVLTFTSLFPSAAQPAHGIFVYQRMSHFVRRPGNEVVAVAPVPYFPSWLRGSKWRRHSQVPLQEKLGSLAVYHPRYFLLPKISMVVHGWLLFLGSWRLVRRLHRESPFDCIDAHYVYPDGFAAVLLGRVLRVPVVVSARGTDVNLFPSFRTIRPMIRWTLQQVAGAISVSSSLQQAMLAQGLRPDKSRVVGNGVDLERFQPLARSEARRHLGLSEDAEILVSVGALIPSKGYQFLIPAITELAPKHPKLKLYIIGAGPWLKKLQFMIQNLGLQQRVTLMGPLPNEELKFWYNAADVSCLASSREGWPNVILESMACGTPVVATRVGGTPEVIVSSELGLLVDQTTESIAGGLQTALNRIWDRKIILGYASQRTWAKVAAEVEEFFRERLFRRPGREQVRAAERRN